MNAAAAAPRTGFKFMLSVRSGPDAGAVYQLLPPRVTLGRDPASNSVVINDGRVSRNAAVIDFTPQDITIQDVSGRSRMTVNGAQGEFHSLKGGDIIAIGESEIAFVVEAVALPAVVNAQPRSISGGAAALPGTVSEVDNSEGTSRSRSRSSRSSQQDGGRGIFYFVVFLVLAGMIYIGTKDARLKRLDKGLKTTSEIEKEISDSETRTSELTKKRTFRTEEEKTRYEEAQKHYLEGFRDYQKGNYARAMRSFETARAIDPDHQLAKRYYRLSEKQRDETVTQLLLEGRRYREKNMYSRCSAALEKALNAMTNKDDLKYKQAETTKKECDILQENRF